LVGLLLPALAMGAVYKRVQPDGTVLFSDEPLPGSEKIEVPPINVYTPPELPSPAPSLSTEAKPPPAEEERYSRVEILMPGPQDTLRNTGFTVDVAVLIEPDLKDGHRIVPVLDGKPLAPTTEPEFTLTEVYRGTHTLQVQIQSAEGQVLAASPVVTFYMHQMSLLFPTNPLNPPP
jgi:hypothetical protein